MPQDCEINWREHRPSIKSRHIFGMIFDSTSKHHTVNMKLLLVILACLAVSSALPVEKQKRDILPGDPRYGTNQHHHHENVIEDARTSSGYSHSFPEVGSQTTSVHVPANSYGPPGYQPGVPLHKEYLGHSSDVTQYSTPVPNYEVSDPVQVSQPSNTYIPVNTETKKTVTTTTVNVPVQHTKTVNVGPPATSYGTPVVHHTKTSVDTSSDSRVATTHKTVKTKVHDQQVVDLPTPSVRVAQHTPVTQGVTHFTSGVRNIPTVSTTFTKNVHADTLFTDNLPNYQSSFGGFYDVPSYNIPSYSPSVYTNLQPAYDTIQSGYTGLGVNYPLRTLNHQVEVHQPITTQYNTIPTSYSYSQTAELPQTAYQLPQSNYQLPQTNYQLPQTLTHLVEQVQPLQSVHSAPSVKTVQSYTPVETLTQVHSVHPVHTASSVSTVDTATPVQRVQSVAVLPSVQGQQHTIESVNTGTPLVHSQVQKGPISDFFENLSQNFPSLPSFPTLPSFPSLPSLPGLPSTASPVESAPQVNSYASDNKDSITVENPLLSSDNNLKGTVVQHVTPANEYVQPTDANGGYVY